MVSTGFIRVSLDFYSILPIWHGSLEFTGFFIVPSTMERLSHCSVACANFFNTAIVERGYLQLVHQIQTGTWPFHNKRWVDLEPKVDS